MQKKPPAPSVKLSPTRRKAYAAAKHLGWALHDPRATSAALLTVAQADGLCAWAQDSAVLRQNLNDEMSLQDALDLYHASIVYDGFDSFYAERNRDALLLMYAVERRIRDRSKA